MYRNLQVLPLSAAFLAASLLSAAAGGLGRTAHTPADLRAFIIDDSGFFYGLQGTADASTADGAN